MDITTKTKWLAPLGAIILALSLVLLVTFPLLTMEVKDIPVAILSLDEAVTTPAGEVNTGSEMVKNITKADIEAIDWQTPKTETELAEAMDDGQYYAQIVIPKNYTAGQIQGEDIPILVTINEGKSPMVATILSTMITSLSENTGLNLEIERINPTTQYGFLAMFLPMVCILLTCIASIVTGFAITRCFDRFSLQLVYIVVGAGIIGFAVAGIMRGLTGMDIDVLQLGLYLSRVSISFMLLVNGAVNLFPKHGIIIPALILVLGLVLVQLPYEFLNGFWQQFVASWEPLRYFGEGVREVLYQDKGGWNSAAYTMVTLSTIGFCTSALVKLIRD